MIATTGRVFNDTATWGGNEWDRCDTWGSTAASYWTVTGTPDDDQAEQRAREALERWLTSRNWTKAPVRIKPRTAALSLGVLFHFRIAPRFWTGKNYRKCDN